MLRDVLQGTKEHKISEQESNVFVMANFNYQFYWIDKHLGNFLFFVLFWGGCFLCFVFGFVLFCFFGGGSNIQWP